MSKTTPEQNKALVLEAFDTLFNKRDYAAAERFWSDRYIQHSAHIAPDREGLFDLIRSAPPTLRYELILAEGDYVIAHGRFSGMGRPAAWVAADVVASRTASSPSIGTSCRTKRHKRNPSAACRCSATAFPPDFPYALTQRTTAMPLDATTARDLVSPIYDALTHPGEKDVEALIKSVTSPDFQSCGNEGECAGRDAVIARFKGLADVVPDLAWTIKALFVAGDDTIVVRCEATGTPVRPFLGAEATGRSFRTMSIDLYTVADSKIVQSYHVENWTAALRQLASG